MKHGSILFLKLAIILFGMLILFICIFLVPDIANYSAEIYPHIAYIKYLVFIGLYAAAVPFYFALYQALKFLSYIDNNNAFSEASLKAIKNIKNCAIAISVLYVPIVPLNFIMVEVSDPDPPGIKMIGAVIVFASIIVAVFASVIERLFKYVVHIKSENDLTV